jgi:menaquinone-dependent protoporphyrinogen IX oxidase
MVVYASTDGNKGKVAGAIGQALGAQEDVTVVHAGDAVPEQLARLALLVVGSPAQQFRPTGAITRFLKGIPWTGLQRDQGSRL